ncbi:MAG TPA: UbiX family flavin prenyltransferase [Legionella sp.]|nr:UbiX family flavin prenyltransferase [Legionella sp.]
MNEPKRMIVGISGASGIIYGIELLKTLRNLNIESHLVITKSGELTRAHETDMSAQEVRDLADYCHPIQNLAAPISSGSFKTMGMIIAPCSMRSLAEIANGISSNLLTRAADVILKDRRRLVALVREFPLHAGHLKNMLAVTQMGGIIAPPVPAFYTRPQSIHDIIVQTLGRTLDLFDIDTKNFPRWGEEGKYSSSQQELIEN